MGIKGFFAYSSHPSIKETVKDAIADINGSGVITITSWEDLSTSGVSIINNVLEEIDNSEIFLADLTYLNPNVLFELGYAIARNRRTVVFLDPSIEEARYDFDRFNLSTVGFLGYHNSSELARRFFEENPCENLHKTILSEKSLPIVDGQDGILFLKSLIDTQASTRLHQRLERSKIRPLIVDDPQEIRMQIHSWYVEQVYRSYAVVGHLLGDDRSGKDLHNAKVSFVAGLACGFGRKVIMLAQVPYDSPLDYRHLLRKHDTAIECVSIMNIGSRK